MWPLITAFMLIGIITLSASLKAIHLTGIDQANSSSIAEISQVVGLQKWSMGCREFLIFG
jgi:hypothetical protein